MDIPPPLASMVNLDAHGRSDLRIQPPARCNRPTTLQDGNLARPDPVHFNYPYNDQGQLTDDGTNTYDYDLGGNRDTGYTVAVQVVIIRALSWT
jgi:hypothetical protein